MADDRKNFINNFRKYGNQYSYSYYTEMIEFQNQLKKT